MGMFFFCHIYNVCCLDKHVVAMYFFLLNYAQYFNIHTRAPQRSVYDIRAPFTLTKLVFIVLLILRLTESHVWRFITSKRPFNSWQEILRMDLLGLARLCGFPDQAGPGIGPGQGWFSEREGDVGPRPLGLSCPLIQDNYEDLWAWPAD